MFPRGALTLLVSLLPALAGITAEAQPLRVRHSGAGSTASHSPASDTTQVREPLRFVFDDAFIGSPGLTFSVDRPQPTWQWNGEPLGPDAPRFAPRTTIAGAVDVQDVRPSSRSTTIIGSGFDHDGTTPLLVLTDSTANVLDVFVGADDALMLAEATGVGRIRTPLGVGGGVDIMQGTVTNRRYDPRAGAVCHGLIVLFCAVSRQPVPPFSAWNTGATAIVVSQDRGTTWTVAFEDTIVQENRDRVREWSMQNWWPASASLQPLEAYFAAADYRSKPGCDGGRAYGFRATRPAPGSPWNIEPPVRFYETPVAGAGQHAHTAGIFPTPSGLRAIVAIGDTQQFNRIVALDKGGEAVTTSGWTANESFHGSAAGTDPQPTSGNQFVGLAPGPANGLMILGSDLCYEQLMMLDATGPVARHWRLYGAPWSDGRNSQNFVIRTPTPERAGPYVATYDPQVLSEPVPPQIRRALYSENGVDWAQAFAPETGSAWSAAVHGSHIYIDSDPLSRLGLRRATRPTLHSAHPLAVGPGAMQRLAPNPTFTPFSGGSVVPLTKDALGRWVDGGTPLDPQPPCAGPVWKLTGFAGSSDTRIGDLFPIGSPTMGQTLGTNRIIARVWLLNALESKAMTPRIELKPNSSGVIVTRFPNANTTMSWVPVDFALDAPIPAGQRPVLRIRSGSTADAQSFYLATDLFAEGAGFAGYPAPPDTSLSQTGSALPDERAVIEGFAPANAWTISLAGMLPDDGWDLAVPVGPGLRWPLATIAGSADERLTIYADTAAHAAEADITRNGTLVARFRLDGVVWTRNSPVLLSIARPGSGADLQISASLCAAPVREMVRVDGGPLVATLLHPPTSIRFDDGSGIDGLGLEIRSAAMNWFGGQIIEDRALDAPARRALLRSLEFLRP